MKPAVRRGGRLDDQRLRAVGGRADLPTTIDAAGEVIEVGPVALLSSSAKDGAALSAGRQLLPQPLDPAKHRGAVVESHGRRSRDERAQCLERLRRRVQHPIVEARRDEVQYIDHSERRSGPIVLRAGLVGAPLHELPAGREVQQIAAERQRRVQHGGPSVDATRDHVRFVKLDPADIQTRRGRTCPHPRPPCRS